MKIAFEKRWKVVVVETVWGTMEREIHDLGMLGFSTGSLFLTHVMTWAQFSKIGFRLYAFNRIGLNASSSVS